MSGSFWRRASCWIAILLAGAPAGASVGWVHLAPGCAVAPGDIQAGQDEKPQVVRCGGAGSFVFGKPGLQYDGPCHSPESGNWTPSLLPVEPAPRLSAAFPCAGGLCFGRRSPDRPWVAILDWPTAHGWSVAATVQEASDQRVDVQLYDLTNAGALAQWVPSVSDLHVLVQLCSLAETVGLHPGDRPLAVNMSFGRLQTGPDCGSGSTQGCPVSQVLSHLAAEGIVPVAAAGNHREMLFPASSLDVISAGALDLAHFQHTGEPRASAQTPPQAEALMPGYGLYLSALSVSGEGAYWPVPPGSSYAAALFTGWLSGTVAGGGKIPDPSSLEGTRWEPVTQSGTATVLALDGVPLPGSGLNGPRRLLDRALGTAPVSQAPRISATLRLTGPAPPLPELPLPYADNGNGPQPGVDPCVPCGPGGGGQGGTPQGNVLLDLSYSGGLPPQMDLVAVLLRVGTVTYAFDGSRDPALLAAMAAGSLEGLALSETGGAFQSGEQSSLVLVINIGGLAYWHEVPFHMR